MLLGLKQDIVMEMTDYNNQFWKQQLQHQKNNDNCKIDTLSKAKELLEEENHEIRAALEKERRHKAGKDSWINLFKFIQYELKLQFIH
jgi:hypothetical protein